MAAVMVSAALAESASGAAHIAPGVGSRHIDQPVHTAAFWKRWLQPPEGSTAAPGVPSCDADALLQDHPRLVVVAPHPDDEVLMCSGLLLRQLNRGGAVHIAALTDGEACFGTGPQVDRAAIGVQRRLEAAAGLAALGLQAAQVEHFGLPDGAVAAHERMAYQRLRALLKPNDLVVCPWHLDGHPDHEAAARAANRACEEQGARLLQSPVWMWHWARPDHPAIDWRPLLLLPLAADAVARKWQALQCHASQLQARDAEQASVVDAALQARARWPFEVFFKA